MNMIDPEHSERNNPERAEARGALVVARGEAPELLAAGEEVLHPVAQPVQLPVERPGPMFIALARNGGPDPSPPAVLADRAAAVPLVCCDSVGPQPRPAPTESLNRPLAHQLGEHRRLVGLARGEHEGYGLASAIGSEV